MFDRFSFSTISMDVVTETILNEILPTFLRINLVVKKREEMVADHITCTGELV